MLDPDAFEWRDDVREPELPDNPFVEDATDSAPPALADGASRAEPVPAPAPAASPAPAVPADDAAARWDAELGDESPFAVDPETGRRTVTITGRPESGRRAPVAASPRQAARRDAHRTAGATGAAGAPRRRSGGLARRTGMSGTSARVAQRPDRIALWAVLMALALVLAAATTSRADAPADSGHAPAALVAAPR